MQRRPLTAYLHSADILVIGFLVLLSALILVFFARIPHGGTMMLINAIAITLIFGLGYARHTISSKVLRYVHDWYIAPAVFLSYKELYFLIKPIHYGRDYDDVLIAIDHWLFRVNPTEWVMHLTNPYLTEILQIAYSLFYVLFLILGFELYRRRDPDLFHYFMFTCVYGFFLSYIGYFLLPAVGPRFTLHDFSALDRDLPGVLLTPYLRWFVNAGGSVPIGVPNAIALAGTQRDVFPSGHTMMTLVLMYLSAKSRAKARYFIYVTGTLLVVATVYERYHYVVDLFAGALCMIICVRTSPWLYALIKARFQTIESRS